MNDTARIAVRAGLVPMLWGPPGCGKSAWAASSARPCITIQAACVSREDLSGYPVPDPGRGSVRMMPPTWAIPPDGGVLIIDDLPDADGAEQRAMYGLVLSRRLGTHSLPPGVSVICTGNPPALSARGTELPPALTDRLVHVDCAADIERSALGLWPDPPPERDPPSAENVAVWRARFGGYRRATHGTDAAAGNHGQMPTQRSWEHAAILCAAGLDQVAAMTATVGAATAALAARWLREADIPDPGALAKDHSLLPARADAQFTALAALIAWARGNAARRRPMCAALLAVKDDAVLAAVAHGLVGVELTADLERRLVRIT